MALSSSTKIVIAVGAVAIAAGAAYYYVSEAKKRKEAEDKKAAADLLAARNMATQSLSAPGPSQPPNVTVRPFTASRQMLAPSWSAAGQRAAAATAARQQAAAQAMADAQAQAAAQAQADAPAAPPPINDVMKLQMLLKVAGFYNGPVDGKDSTALQDGVSKIAPFIGVDPKTVSVPVLLATIKAAAGLLNISIPAGA